ncbi:MAG: hypothetical protein JW795_01325 [Chitinivibrionales bacterium]|nr:hypothetical protein [Chitinivibrionales bacterium]
MATMTQSIQTGQVVLTLDDDVSTDIIYPGRFMATVLPTETVQYAFADFAEFNAKIKKNELPRGSIIVAGKNFGCGSSREQAASCLKGAELTVIAKNFSRIFLQNSINLGLNTVICPQIEAKNGEILSITETEVINQTTTRRFPIISLPKARQAIIDAGGLIAYTRSLVLKERQK